MTRTAAASHRHREPKPERTALISACGEPGAAHVAVSSGAFREARRVTAMHLDADPPVASGQPAEANQMAVGSQWLLFPA